MSKKKWCAIFTAVVILLALGFWVTGKIESRQQAQMVLYIAGGIITLFVAVIFLAGMGVLTIFDSPVKKTETTSYQDLCSPG